MPTNTEHAQLSRRAFVRLGAATAAFAAPMLNFNRFQVFAASSEEYTSKAIELVKTNLVIDMLSNMASLQQHMSASFAPNPLTADASELDEAQIRKHIDHIARLVGVEHVGVGSDMDPDGYDDISPALRQKLKDSYQGSYGFRDKIDTDGFDHPKRIYDLTERLLRRGYSAANIGRILGGNFRRTLTQIWKA